jgi:hypothetical protein
MAPAGGVERVGFRHFMKSPDFAPFFVVSGDSNAVAFNPSPTPATIIHLFSLD